METDLSRLKRMVAEIRAWIALQVEPEADGFETHFPRFLELIDMTFRVFTTYPPDHDEAFSLIEYVCKISEEDYCLVDFLEDKAHAFTPWIERLAESQYPEVRWQIAVVCMQLNAHGITLLLSLRKDQHPYVRRRALLSLIDMGFSEVDQHIEQMCSDPDDLNRKIAYQLKEERKKETE